ncbi:LrgB family protein [Acinetobacter schindleri]|jgi:putative effector of murein hydrolase|uniref:LrgB family protein n=1 Tax=Acinetobacter TaxID=469 RepID=UPI0006623BFD|nr:MULTISPECIES: LrgB family protein [Acinetobacter]KMU99570.1 membrane protein [Acinetobacter sp. VT 511]PUQ99751.1 LrgB family protein [Acinetobacter schindleri]
MTLIAIVCLISTLLFYTVVKKIHQKYPYLILSPAILSPILLIILILSLNISYDTYMQDNQWIVWMLGPATVAFAIPIYEYREIIKTHLLSISMGVVIGMLAGMISSFYLAKLFNFDQSTTYSLMARSISTPFAMELSNHIGGSVELVILFTMITGVIGMIIGDIVLAALPLKSHFVMGASLGNAAHGFGTTKAYSRDKEEGVIASLTMVLAGIFMVLVGPFLVHLLV